MNSNNIKIIDEHNIDRVANKICSIDVDGSNYIIYSIERDSDNDNIFVSKLINNINNTCSMLNIDDSMEKEKLSTVVKELIKFAVDSEDNKLSSENVPLLDGVNVKIVSPLIDSKEQNINVQKTYITTVKKSVTKVSSDFYGVNFNLDTELFNDTKVDNAFASSNDSLEKNEDNTFHVDDIIANPVAPEVPSIDNTVIPEAPSIDNTVIPEAPSIDNPVIPEVPSIDNSVIPEVPSIDNPVTPEVPSIDNPVTLEVPSIDNTVAPEVPSIDNPVIPEVPNMDDNANNNLVFDASKEVNLNQALGEVSSSDSISVNDVSPIREFGVDNDAKLTEENKPTGNVTGNKGGFANNKFLTTLFVILFIAACAFLGYEIFNYFSSIK